MIEKIFNFLRGREPRTESMAEKPVSIWPNDPAVSPVMHHEEDLVSIDQSYAGMYVLHAACHAGLIEELRSGIQGFEPKPRLLEVACGSGWNTKALNEAGFEYWGLDLSENAIAVALRRYPSFRFINCDIRDTHFIADNAFEYVFSASMLEHLGDYQNALKNMIRMSKKHLYVLFYEGLSKDSSDEIKHFPFDNPEWNRWFGKKLSAYQHEHSGYFMNKFSQQTIKTIVAETPHAGYEIFSKGDRSYIGNESILHVWK